MPVLTYNGDVTHMVGEVKGPTLHGEYLTAVRAELDETHIRRADGTCESSIKTIVHFAYGMRCEGCGGILDADEQARVGQMMAGTSNADRLRARAAHRVCPA